jgi:hypothetical protein
VDASAPVRASRSSLCALFALHDARSGRPAVAPREIALDEGTLRDVLDPWFCNPWL